MSDGIIDQEMAGLDVQIPAPEGASAGLFKVGRWPKMDPAFEARYSKAVAQLSAGKPVIIHNVKALFSIHFPEITVGDRVLPEVTLPRKLIQKLKTELGTSPEYVSISALQAERLTHDTGLLSAMARGEWKIVPAIPATAMTAAERLSKENVDLKKRIRELEAAQRVDAAPKVE
jgi:hypothetical protein